LLKDAKRLTLGVTAGLVAFYNSIGTSFISKQSIFFSTTFPNCIV